MKMAYGWIRRAVSETINSIFKVVTYSISYLASSVSVNEVNNFSATDFDIVEVSGYKPICIRRFGSGSSAVGITIVNGLATGTTVAMQTRCLKTFTPSDVITVRLEILYAREEFVV